MSWWLSTIVWISIVSAVIFPLAILEDYRQSHMALGENPEILYKSIIWVEKDNEYIKVYFNIRGDEIPYEWDICGYANGIVPIIELEEDCLTTKILDDGRCWAPIWHEIVHIKISGSNMTAEHIWMEENLKCY